MPGTELALIEGSLSHLKAITILSTHALKLHSVRYLNGQDVGRQVIAIPTRALNRPQRTAVESKAGTGRLVIQFDFWRAPRDRYGHRCPAHSA